MMRRAASADPEQVVDVFERSFATLDFLRQLHTHEENVAHFAGVLDWQDVWVAERDGRVAGPPRPRRRPRHLPLCRP